MIKFSVFMESEDSLSELRKHLDSLGVEHHISHGPGSLTISKIVVPKEHRNKGLGSKAMSAITQHADKYHRQINLTPDSSFGGTKSRLVSFYKRHGFIENKGRNKDFSTRDTMYRAPKKD